MVLSVIIPCLNEADYITDLLDCLSRQTLGEFEVIVVDSRSTDQTAAIVRAYPAPFPLRVVAGSRGVANARNTGAACARGEWLYFLDADVTFDEELLERSLAEVQARGLGVASPTFQTDSPEHLHKVGSWVSLRYCRLLSRTRFPVAGGFAILIKRSLHHKIGAFDPKLKLGEDHYYVCQAVRAGENFGYLNSTSIITSMRRFQDVRGIKVFSQYVFIEFYRLSHGLRVEDELFAYEFGNHKKSSASVSSDA
jgi:glycosyltransferase involved in cell wall biosynthesis